jgi:hypothetical protein
MNIELCNITQEEADTIFNLVEEMKAKRKHEQKYQENRQYLRDCVISTIDCIGLEDTKKIIREINRDLREK